MTRLLTLALAVLTLAFAAPALAAPKVAAPPQWAWDSVARVVVIGDLHGDYGKFRDQLLQAGLIDGKDRWKGGKTHLVQLGDVPDRAADTRKILELLMKLEPQAKKAGGYVHALVGNHEGMNVTGDLRYTTPAEFAAFADKKSAKLRDAYAARVIAALTASPPGGVAITFDAAWRARFDAEHPLGWVEHRVAWSPKGRYGAWVATHSAIIRINDTLYMHGGIGPAFLPFEIADMNAAVSAALLGLPAKPDGPSQILDNDQGPLWYRGLAMGDPAAEAPHVAALLARYGVKHVILGHTKAFPMVRARFDGAVILTDIAVPVGCADPHAFLIRDGDALTAVHRGQRVPLGVSGDAETTYLTAIAAIDATAPPCPARAPAAAPATPS